MKLPGEFVPNIGLLGSNANERDSKSKNSKLKTEGTAHFKSWEYSRMLMVAVEICWAKKLFAIQSLLQYQIVG